MQEIQTPSNFHAKIVTPGARKQFLDRNLSLTFGAERRVWVASAAYVLFLCLFEGLYLHTGFISLIEWVRNGNDVVTMAIAAVYGLGAIYLSFLFVLAALSSRWPYKLIYFAVFAFGIAVEYGYSRAIDRFTTGYDVSVALSATADQQYYAASAYLEPSSLLAIFAFGGMMWAVGPKLKRGAGAGILAVVAIGAGLFSIHLAFVNPILFDRQFTGTSLSSFFLTSAEYFVYEPLSAPVSREAVEAPTNISQPQNNIVVVFDESVRGDHLSLNGYERQTTPFLDDLARRKVLANFGVGVSGATSSALSFYAFVTGATPEDVAINGFAITKGMPNVFQYAKAMGYRTYYIDGQRTEYWGGGTEDTRFLDHFMSSREIVGPNWEHEKFIDRGAIDRVGAEDKVDPWEMDVRIAETVRDIYSESTGNFIFVYKRGTHIPYENAYPANETTWKPAYNWDDYYEIPGADKLKAVNNSYDNSIRYNVDGFFRSLATDYNNLPNNTVIAYTSDHGESLYAQGAAGHGDKSREEAMVPMFLIGLKDHAIDTSFKASHSNLFTSLLDLMGYPEEARRHAYAISLLKARGSDSAKRFFNPNAQGKVPFD